MKVKPPSYYSLLYNAVFRVMQALVLYECFPKMGLFGTPCVSSRDLEGLKITILS